MSPKTLGEAVKGLDEIISRLLDPDTGCPWDIKQTLKSVTGNVLEETYELIEALRNENAEDIKEEAGDVLFQIVFVARLAQKRWNYGLKEIADQVCRKMVERHPHVFGKSAQLADDQAVLDQWQAIKRRDKKHEHLLASVPKALPALQRAHRLNDRAGRAGFDWPDAAAVREAVGRELCELDEAINGYDRKTASSEIKAHVKHELGDVLLVLSNLSRHLGFSAEDALAEANDRFVKRFNFMEDALSTDGLRPEDVSMDKLEELWHNAKKEVFKENSKI